MIGTTILNVRNAKIAATRVELSATRKTEGQDKTDC
jgi:hypothetical protein